MAESKKMGWPVTSMLQTLPVTQNSKTTKNKKHMCDFRFFFGRPLFGWEMFWQFWLVFGLQDTRITPVGTQLNRVCLLHFFVFQKNDGTPKIWQESPAMDVQMKSK